LFSKEKNRSKQLQEDLDRAQRQMDETDDEDGDVSGNGSPSSVLKLQVVTI